MPVENLMCINMGEEERREQILDRQISIDPQMKFNLSHCLFKYPVNATGLNCIKNIFAPGTKYHILSEYPKRLY